MPKARKEHICSLCHAPIIKGTEYIYQTITIWDHLDNETFGTYKAHKQCDALWMDGIGLEMDWILPYDQYEWDELQSIMEDK